MRTLATARRVLQQLGHDRRSIALLLVVPSGLLVLLKYVYSSEPFLFDRLGPQLLGLFPFIVMFLITSITMVRERTSGTLERLLTTPLRRAELVFGYGLAFGLAALIQACVTAAITLGPLGLNVHHAVFIGLFAVLDALLGTGLGLLMSAFATTEFQAVQFMPALVIPQLLLCGLFVPRDQLPRFLEVVSNVLPLSYAVDAMQHVAASAATVEVWQDLALVAAYVVAGLALGALTLRRQSA
jgi:ABC-2 type transport system permease protein